MNRVILGLVLLLLLIFPAFNMPYLNTFLIILFLYVLLAQSYDLLGGYTGYINMGHICFFGVGAYTFGILWNKGLPLYLSFVAGGVAAVLFALIISFPFFRLRGAYFSLAAFALVKLMEHLTLNLPSLTQGSDGLMVLQGNRMIPMYYLSLFLVVAVIAVTYFITRSRLGLAMASVREQEEIASDFGVPVQRVKAVAMVIAASFAGVMGAFYTWYTIFINPEMVFGTEIALMPLAMAMLGGSGVIIGPVIGAIFLFIVEETLWTRMAYLHFAAYGLVILFVGLFMPGGLVRLRPIRRALLKMGLYQEI
ncbi:MAG: branched-chain amino acid ABC transporter permease [Deltaproteobacteria bacterium]|nr:MAG: branched-chain amino acid ABC transporter permease [Deltaproteobacteria bacterium]